MSPLTKLFVVLLVVLSLLLTAGTVVFVNQVGDFKKSNDLTMQQLGAERSKGEAMRNELDSTRARIEAGTQQANAQLEQAKQKINQLLQDGVQKDTQIAQGTSQQQLQAVENTTLAGGLKAAEERMSRMQDQLNDLRGSNDKLVAQNGQLNLTVTDLTNRLEVTERERRLLAEQLTEAKGQVDRQGAMLRDYGVSPAQLASAGSKIGAPAINGVIREVRSIRGVLYAEISVGTADSVAPGMEFKVVSRDGAFLGLLTIDTVQLNQATGRLSGPRVTEIKTGAEVKTQL